MKIKNLVKKNCLYLVGFLILVYLGFVYGLPLIRNIFSLKEGLFCSNTYPRLSNGSCPPGFKGIGCTWGGGSCPTPASSEFKKLGPGSCGCWPEISSSDVSSYDGNEYNYTGVRKTNYDKTNWAAALNPPTSASPTTTTNDVQPHDQTVIATSNTNANQSSSFGMTCSCSKN